MLDQLLMLTIGVLFFPVFTFAVFAIVTVVSRFFTRNH